MRQIALPGMPNFYTMMGNNFLVNHSSVTEVLEIQAAYITQMIQAMRDHRIPKLEVKRTAAVKYDTHIANQLERTTWPLVHNYWRKGGTGRIFTHYPGSILQQWWDNAWPVWADYTGGEKLARRQKFRTFIFVLSLLVGAALGGSKIYTSGILKRLYIRGDALGRKLIAKLPLDKLPLDKLPLNKLHLDKLPLDKLPIPKKD